MVPHTRQSAGAEAGRSLTGITEDSWLSGVLGRSVYRVDASAPPASLAALPAPSFAYAKVDAAAITSALRLQEAGFRVVDVNLSFSRPSSEGALPSPKARVARVGMGDADAVLAIAESCFRYSRFHLDPSFPEGKAHAIKRAWVESYVHGKRGNGLYAAFQRGKPAGFLAVLISGKQAVIDLIGVGVPFQGRGLGRDLVRFFVNEYRSRCETLAVGTQAANIPSMRLYESCGFKMIGSALVLHRHAS